MSSESVSAQMYSVDCWVDFLNNDVYLILFIALIYTVDTSTTLQDDKVTIKLNKGCKEDPTSFMTTLSYGSCPNSLQYATSQVFNSSGVASFELQLDIENVIGNMCLQVEMIHQISTVTTTFVSDNLTI